MADIAGRTILIAGPPFRGYLRMIGEAFKACGLQPSFLEWQYPERGLLKEIMYYSSQSFRSRLAETQDKANSKALEKAILDSDPRYLLAVKAVELTEETIRHCSDVGTKLVLWAYDSAIQFPIISKAAPKYDLVYTYEPADIESLSRVCKPKHLPMAFDPKYYYRHSEGVKKYIDISFVGAVDPYPQRRRLLRHISSVFKDKTIAVWTDSVHWYSHRKIRDRLLFGTRRNIDLHWETLGHGAINDIYNRSRVCLNIHNIQSAKAVNPRTFEILGSGGLLLTDRRLDEIDGFGDGKGYLHYSNESELVEKLRVALDDETMARSIADTGHSKVKAHTYEDRARTMLADLK